MASFADAVAPPGYRPRDWQSPAPDSVFGPRGLPVEPSPDLERVLALSRRTPPDLTGVEGQALVLHEMRKYARDRGGEPCRCREIAPLRDSCLTTLLPAQAWALYEIAIVKGLIGSLPVGSGKSLLDILSALALGVDTLLLVPASLVTQIWDDYRLLREHFRVPNLILHTGKYSSEDEIVDVELPTLRVMSYDRLSQPDSSARLNEHAPRAIIADECDALKDMMATRTVRVLRYLREHPNTYFCGWTGSLTDHALTEFCHLSAIALREGSPLPLDPEVARDWDRCLGASPSPCPPGALLELCEPGEEVRRAFGRRMAETRGFVITTDSKVMIENSDEEVQVSVTERVAPEIPKNVEDVLASIRNGIRPDSMFGARGDEILVDKLHIATAAQQAATGVVYYWDFPRGESDDLIDEWFDARKEYNSEVREKLLNGDEDLDSPTLLERAARRHWGDDPNDPVAPKPEWECHGWPRWRDVRDRVEPHPKAFRLSDFLVLDAIEWAAESTGIVWYTMDEFARWMHELSDIPMFGGGKENVRRLKLEDGSRSIICSMNSHGRGRNGLQFAFDHQLVANTPASDTRFQQLLGRLHRRGQKAGVIRTDVYLHVPEIRKSFDQACQRGGYVEELIGERRKLLMGLEYASAREGSALER